MSAITKRFRRTAIKKTENSLLPLTKYEYEVPADLRPYFGGAAVTVPEDTSQWYMFHSKRLPTLSETTQRQYKRYYDILESSPHTDIWDTVRFVMGQSLQTQAGYIKASLAYASDRVHQFYRATQVRHRVEYENAVFEMQVWATLSRVNKRAVRDNFDSQTAGAAEMENMVAWDEWEKKSAAYIKQILRRPRATVGDLQLAAIAGVYSYLPPIRLDYDNVTVVRTATGMPRSNTLVLAGPKTSRFIWYNFKNSRAFSDLPIVSPVPAPLLKVLKRYQAARFPDGAEYPYKLFTVANFSGEVSRVGEIITGLRFGNRLMRRSYIKAYHAANRGDFNINETKKMMRTIHQTSIEINLGYLKRLAEGAESDVE